MVQVERTDTSDGVDPDATFIPLSAKKFPEKSSRVCFDDLNHLSILSNLQLHLFNEIPRAKEKQRQRHEALLTGKKDAWQNTDPFVLSSRSGQKQKTLKFAKWLHLLLGIIGIVMAVTFCWTTYPPSKSIKMETNIGFPTALIEPCKRSVVSALEIVYQSIDETCQAGKYQKVIPAYPQVILPESIKLTKVNISKMLEDKGLGQWSSSVTRAIPPKNKEFNLRMPLYYQQCKSRFTLSITDGDEVKMDSGFKVQSRFDILHGFDTMGTCHMVSPHAQGNQSWECRLLVVLEELKKDLKAIPRRAYDKLLEDEYSKLKIKPGIFSDILKLLKVHFELENVITSRKMYKASRGTASNNIFINVHLKCLHMWKTPQARAHKLPKLEGLSMNRKLLTEDVALDPGYYVEGSELEPGIEVLSHMVIPAIIFEPFSSPPYIPVGETVEDDPKGHSPASNFTHDFTSLGLQGDSSQRPARKAMKGSGSGHEGHNSGNFLQGLTVALFAAIVWVVTATVSSYSLIDCCRLSTYILITAICMVSMELTCILRGVFQAGFKLFLHFSICLLHCLLLMTVYFVVELPSGMRRLTLFQYMEEQLLKYIKYAADQAYSNLRTVDRLLMFAILVGHPEVAAEKQETNTEADSGLMELYCSTSEDEPLLKSARSDDVQRVEESNINTSSPEDRPDECVGACGGLPLDLIQTVEDPDTTERTGKDEFLTSDELKKLLKRTESSVSIDSVGLFQENVKLFEEIQNTDILKSEVSLPSRKHMKYETGQNISRIGESEHVGRDAYCPEPSSIYTDKLSSVLLTSRTQQTPEFADLRHALKKCPYNKYMGKDFMTLEVGPIIRRNFSEMMVDDSDALNDSNKHDAEQKQTESNRHKTGSLKTDDVNGVTWPGSASEVSQQTQVELNTDLLHGKSAGSEEDTDEGEVTASGGQRNQICSHPPVSVNPTQEIPDTGRLAEPDTTLTEEKLLLKQEERQAVFGGDHRINLSQIQNCLQNQIPTTVTDSIYSDSTSSNFYFDEEELPGQQSSTSVTSLLTSGPDVTKAGASSLTVRCKSEEHDCQRQAGIKQGTSQQGLGLPEIAKRDEKNDQTEIRTHFAPLKASPPLYFPSFDGEDLAVVHPPPEYFDERLVVDILNPPKRKYQWQSKIYISGSFRQMMNFLLGIESAVDGSGVFLNRISPLNIDGGILHYWKIPQHSDGHRDMYMDIRNDTVYFDEKIELERFLNIRRRYEMYIDRQQGDAQILKIYGVTKSVEGGCHFVHILYEQRKIVANISVFIAHDASCCGGRSTCQMFRVPKGSKVKQVLLRPEVEALKTMISVQHPHLKDNLYIKLRVAGCSWYPYPSTRLHYNCILQLVDSK